MPRPKNVTDSFAPTISEISFKSGDKGQSILPQEFLQSIELDLFGSGGWAGGLKFFDRLGGVLENLVISSGSKRELAFRFGWDNTGGIKNLPLFNSQIVKLTPTFTPEGVELDFQVVDLLTGGAVANKKVRQFPEGKTASAMFAELAKDRGWVTKDEKGSTIEESTFKSTTPITSDDESDIRFIKYQLLPLATNADGKGFRFFFGADNTAHFHSLDFRLDSEGAAYQISAEYIFGRDSMGEVISFSPSDDIFTGILAGGGEATFLSIDSSKGTVTRIPAKHNEGPEGVNLTVKNDAAYTSPVPQPNANEPHAKVDVITRDVGELEVRANSIWSVLKQTSYTAELVVRGTHAIQFYDYINVRYIKSDGQDHYLSGIFLVVGAKHFFDNGGWKTTCKLVREGFKKTPFSKPEDKVKGKPVTVGVGGETQQFPNVQAAEISTEKHSVPIQQGSSKPR